MRRVAALAAAALVLGGAAGARGAGGPRLTAPHPCPDDATLTCWTLRVPLDRTGRRPGTLALRVAAAPNTAAPRGVLLALSGGPGQPGEPLGKTDERIFGTEVLTQYRLVVIDQRGTGAGALRCPALQRQMGFSDLYPPSAAAVRSCAATFPHTRDLYGTDDTVADLDALRRALGVKTWTLDGISYGTYVAERYALAHPRETTRLVLDSVVPHDADASALLPLDFRAVARVLRLVCAEGPCAGDPVSDLAAVVRRDHDGPRLYDALVALSVFEPTFRRYWDVPALLHRARAGRTAALTQMLRRVHAIEQGMDATSLSQGLHAAALCGDFRFPWGGSEAPRAGREAAVATAARAARAFPFDAATVAGNGIVRQCLPWPPVAATPLVRGPLPAVSALLLEGDHDMSAPLEWGRHELALAPRGRLVLVRGTGHSTQTSRLTDAGRTAARAFLLG
jgi:pimeloyl-ACP methyl ester carboxylesterase